MTESTPWAQLTDDDRQFTRESLRDYLHRRVALAGPTGIPQDELRSWFTLKSLAVTVAGATAPVGIAEVVLTDFLSDPQVVTRDGRVWLSHYHLVSGRRRLSVHLSPTTDAEFRAISAANDGIGDTEVVRRSAALHARVAAVLADPGKELVVVDTKSGSQTRLLPIW